MLDRTIHQAADAGPGFVGRAREMTALRAALQATAGGRGRLVLLVGEAGIGKTRTAAEFAREATARGALVVHGGCYEGEWAPAYGPLAEALTAYVRGADAVELRADLGLGAAPLARMVAGLRERFPDLPEPTPLQPDEARFRLFDAVSQLLIAAAARSPMIVVLDDLHWADQGTIAMLRHVARLAPQHRLMLLGTYRDVELGPQHPLTDALGALYRETTCERILLQGLDEQEVAQLIADSEAPREMRGKLAGAISAATNGNPFFVREVLQHLIEESRYTRGPSDQTTAIAIQPIAIPDSVRQVLTRRVRRLSADTSNLLTVAAAFGGPFHLQVAANVASLDDATALNAIDRALRAQLVRPADSAERYEFTHALIRETLYGELSPSRRLRLHRQIAEAMEEAHGERAAEHAAEIAEQYQRSAELPGAERGIRYALIAADRAAATYAHESVATYLRTAWTLLPENDARRPRLLGRLAIALAWAMTFDDALTAATDAANRIATTEGEQAAADFLADATLELHRAGFHRGAWALAAQGLRFVGDRHDKTWVRLMAVDIMRREAEDSDSPGIALDTPERRAVADAVTRLAIVPEFAEVLHHLPGVRVPKSRREALEGFGDDPHALLYGGGEYRRAAALWEKLALKSQREGRISTAVNSWAHLAKCCTALGQFSSARQAHDRSAELATRLVGPNAMRMQPGVSRYDLVIAVDEGWEDLLGAAERTLQKRPAWYSFQFAGVRAAVARSYARLGKADAALALIGKILVALERAPAWAIGYTQIACDAAATLWLAERTDHAIVIERALRDVIAVDFRYPMRDARLGLAHLGALRGQDEEAVEWFSQARLILDEQEAHPLRAIVDYDEALMYARRASDGDRERAVPLLEAALARFHTLGMPGWIRRAEHLLRTGTECQPEARVAGVPRHDQFPLAESLQALDEGRQGSEGARRRAGGQSRGDRAPEGVEAQEGQPSTVESKQESQPAGSTLRIPHSAVTAVFRRDGHYWTVAYAGSVLHLKDSKGLQYVARLLRHPGQEILAIDLAQSAAGSELSEGTPEQISSPTPALDTQAKVAYKRRLEALRDELNEADTNHDIGRAERARSEMDMLAEQLRDALGLGGRDRPVGGDLERARSAVGKRIRAEIKRIRRADSALGCHLAATISTGYFCAYAPEHDAAVKWEL
jgi:tetratricopeptide (TPR) repeat protein